MKLKILICVFFGALTATAQTNLAVIATNSVIITNLVTASPDFREVNGQLYNRTRSRLWNTMTLQFIRQEEGIVFAKKISYKPTYEERYYPQRGSTSDGIGLPDGNYSPGGYRKVKTGDEKVLGATIALKNFNAKNLTTDSEFTVIAMRTGTTNYGQNVIELWDYGAPHIVPVVSTNYSRIKP